MSNSIRDIFEVVVIGSSSSGNSYLMRLYDEVILVECGFQKSRLLKSSLFTPLKLTDAKACLVTHGHRDHAMALKEISLLMPTFASRPTFEYMNVKPRSTNNYLCEGEIRQITKNIAVIPFEVDHDFPHSLGFCILAKDLRILFINDCGSIPIDLSEWRFDYIFIECNYVDQLLHIQMNNAIKDFDKANYKRLERIHKYHLGLAGSRNFLKKLDFTNLKAIFLMHLSDKNANVKMIREDFMKNFPKQKVFICRKNGGLENAK